MQDNFLFDDDDPKQGGKGCDAIHPKGQKLRFKWRWIMECELSWSPGDPRLQSKKRRPCQVSEAILENAWELKAIFWHTDYEAEVRRDGETVGRYHVDYDEGTKAKRPLFSRIDAQLKAEELFKELGKDILRQCAA